MRRYESIFITPTTLSEEAVDELIEKARGLIARSEGEIVDIQKWGERTLAFEIRRNRRGKYYRIDFVAQTNLTSLIQKLEEVYRYHEGVLRWMTARTHKDTTVEAAKEDVKIQKAKPRPEPRMEDSLDGPGDLPLPIAPFDR